MPRKKRGSIALARAEKRLAAVRSIDEVLDLGNGLTIERYTTQIDMLRSLVSEYNSTLSKIDRVVNDLEAAEKTLNDLSELMLLGVAATFGKYSNEYEMAGGVRKSERKRPVRKQPVAVAQG